MMPELNGYQVCRLLKNDPATEDLPIILLTTLDHQEHRFWGREAGADSYVLKSADSAPLEKEVARLLREKKRLPEEERQRKGSPPAGRQRAQTRLTDLLDRLLFEATVANRIREIGRVSGNFDLSLRNFFEFFQELIDYQIALLCQRSSAGPLLVAHLRGTVPAAFLESAKQTVSKEKLLAPKEKESVQQKILNPDCLSKEKPAENVTLAVLSVPFSTSLQEGGLAVFSTNPALYTEETSNTLKIAAQELEPALKFILQSEAMEKLKEDFGAMIVHDLRSPLNTMMSSVSMMGEGLVGALNEEQKKWLARIQESGQKMMSLINDFLDLSKLEAGKIELVKEEVDLKQLIQNSLDTYAVLAQDKKISLANRVDSALPAVIADPRRLDQVLTNLLSNSVKFTGEKGTIEVGASRDGQETRVWVKDSGVGIPSQEIGLVFEKYRQTTSGKTSKHKGTGLGLMICKMIVDAHGGKIWVESEINKGTTFFFSLPLPTAA
jgi:signal transduction histidine kinase/DNA-binding response OmpR family regulator